ncbi:unnamed protein product [Parnassius mnemosyne]|uniref:Uncharacterized protein n=1 Tax=Parnassius mnemosyne TaxID=213953 RepID=A0AAV1LVK6_9NEOP
MNKLFFNTSKCSVMSFTHSRHPHIYKYNIDGVALQQVTEVKDLGVHFTSKLNFREHILKICKKAVKSPRVTVGMTLNADKCHDIKFSRKKTSLATTYYIDGRILSEVPHIRDLGVTLDNKLRYNIHIDNVVNKGFRTLGFLFRNCKQFRDTRTKIIIYSALVRSILEYCSVVWNPHFNIYSHRIEKIQKRFLSYLSYDHNLVKILRTYEDRLNYFNVQPLSNRRQLLDLIFLYKLVNGVIDSSYLLAKLNFRTPLKSKRPLSFIPFVEKSTRSRQARYSPINSLMLSYNAIYKLSHKNCISAIMNTYNKHKDRKVDIDIFSDNLWKFKSDLLNLYSSNNCNSQ